MNSYNTDTFFSNYYNLQSVHFELWCQNQMITVRELVVVSIFWYVYDRWSSQTGLPPCYK